jgi:hypothetical protein
MEIKRGEVPYRILLLEKVTGIPRQSLMKYHSLEIRKLLVEYEKQKKEKAREKNITSYEIKDINDPPTANQIIDAINLMFRYIQRHTREVSGDGALYYVIKEQPGYPLAIEVVDTGVVHWLGWWGNDMGKPYSDILILAREYDHTLMDVGFEEFDREIGESPDYDYDEPYLWADRFYPEDTEEIIYEINPRLLGSNYTINLILDQTYLLKPIKHTDLGKPIVVTTDPLTHLPSWRFSVRHTTRLGYFIYRIFGYTEIADKMALLFNNYGFTKDLYDCIFGASVNYNLWYILDVNKVYRDCEVWGSLPRQKFLGYPYWSRICHDKATYNVACCCTDLCNLIQAIHALVRGYRIDQRIPDLCGIVTGQCRTKTISEIVNTLIQHYYTPCGMVYPIGTTKTVISGIRTNLALTLFTLLAYKLGYREYSEYADNLANVVYNAVIKSNIITLEYGLQVIRPQHYGGEMVSWKCESETQVFYEIPETWTEALDQTMFEWKKMPPEDLDYGVTNAETTLTGLQALRVYLYYKYNTAYPNSSYIP